jgi:CAAX protease family protein
MDRREAEEHVEERRVDANASPTFSRRILALLLILTALPVVLTTITMRLLHTASVFPQWEGPYAAFLAYAAANWVTFVLVVACAGRARLRQCGLRFTIDGRRLGSAVVAFVAGLGVYGMVTAVLRATGIPPIRGMDYASPGAWAIGTLVATTVATAPFCEEVFFRVLWIGALRERVPPWCAAAASVAAFAAIHYPYFGASGVLFISVWALIPIVLFVAFGDLSASLAMHACNNMFAYVIVPTLLR